MRAWPRPAVASPSRCRSPARTTSSSISIARCSPSSIGPDAIERLEAHLAQYPPLEQVEAWFEDAGLVDVKGEWDTFTLLFKSSREFFFAPLIEYGPLAEWKAIAGQGEPMQDVFFFTKEAIDTYFKDRVFAVTIVGAAVTGRK